MHGPAGACAPTGDRQSRELLCPWAGGPRCWPGMQCPRPRYGVPPSFRSLRPAWCGTRRTGTASHDGSTQPRGAVEPREPTRRCGLMPCLAQMRGTGMGERSPSSAATLREAQCVDPSAGWWSTPPRGLRFDRALCRACARRSGAPRVLQRAMYRSRPSRLARISAHVPPAARCKIRRACRAESARPFLARAWR
jgi:hypothetical protein